MASKVICSNCNKDLSNSWNYCPNCGKLCRMWRRVIELVCKNLKPGETLCNLPNWHCAAPDCFAPKESLRGQ